MIDLFKAASRPLAVASTLNGSPINEKSYFSKLVVLTGEKEVLQTPNGRWCYLDSLRLLMRVVGELAVVIPEDMQSLEKEVRTVCDQVWFRAKPTILCEHFDDHLHRASAILNVGHRSRPGSPWTSIGASGWVARVSSNGSNLPNDFSHPNPISSMFAASVGVAEVFKRLVGVSKEVVPDLGLLEFSTYDFADYDGSIGPDLPAHLTIPNTLLVGAGAIGNGVALLASQLPLCGNLHIVDKQEYGDENIGTCVLMEAKGWSGKSKAVRLAHWLGSNSQLEVSGEKAFVADAIGGARCKKLDPSLVLNGLDDVRARHDAQLIWPDLIIDGGISDFGVAVVQHRLDDRGLACLRCAFQLPTEDHQVVQSSLTGLNQESLRDQERLLTMDDVEKANPTKRDWLIEKVRDGKTICSVVSEATLENLGASVESGFRPSVPFVATAAAALMMAETVKALCHSTRTYRQNLAIGNLLLGSAGVGFMDRSADESCVCVLHRALIERLRLNRKPGERRQTTS